MRPNDDQNPNYIFQGIDTNLILAIVNGDIDALALAKEELAKRGFEEKGVWVGFNK